MKLLSLRTRKFPPWLQAFNLLCVLAAAAIAGFGVYHLASRGRSKALEGILLGRGDQATVDTTVLADRLATAKGGTAVGEALVGADEAEALRVLDAGVASCLPGGLTLGSALAVRKDQVGARARAEVANALGLEPLAPPTPEDLEKRVQTFVAMLELRDVTLLLAARTIVQESPWRRDAAIARIETLHDGRGIPALLAALGTPEPERATREAAERALESFVEDDLPEPGDRTTEDRWRLWWTAHESIYAKPPYDLSQNGHLLAGRLGREDEASRRDALRGLGIVRDRAARAEMAKILVGSSDAATRAMAAWALGRTESIEAMEPLRLALADKDAEVRIAAARAIGRARFVPVKLDLEKLLQDPAPAVRRGAALALLGFLDRQGLPLLDAIVFDTRRLAAERLSALRDLDEASDEAAATSRWIGALSDPDQTVRDAAQAALARRISRHEVIVGRTAWERWWSHRYAGLGVEIPLGAGH
ncbi:MAG TPA: HEAT repeat domain-containing protein [Planctomycetota bacterium]|nr:HEAT repeat domain-containing protein [Planctomycetota bacterium]